MNITTEDVNDAQNILEQNLALYNELLNIQINANTKCRLLIKGNDGKYYI